MTQLDTMQQLQKGIAPVDVSAIPSTATPFSACNATIITTTTKQDIKAAVSGKRHWIVSAHVTNITAGETTSVAIQDEDDVKAAVLAAPAASTVEYVFKAPLEIAAGKAIEGIGMVATTGDCHITLHGYVEA